MKIRRRANRKRGSFSWQLDAGTVNGRRWQRSFPTRGAAEVAMRELQAELRRGGERSLTLTDQDRYEFHAAKEKLIPLGAGIMEAVDFFIAHAGRVVRQPIMMEELVRMCVEAKRAEGKRARYLTQLRCTGLAFAGHVGEMRPAHEVTGADVERWLGANAWSAVTCNNYVADLRTIFGWAMERGYAGLNPCTGIKRRTVEAEEIAFVGYDECERLFRRAEKAMPPRPRRDARTGWPLAMQSGNEDFRDFVPMLVLGFFCGLRPERELGEMRKEDIRLDNRLVVVTGGRAKGRRRRTVDLSENALAWLRLGLPFLDGETVMPRNFAKRWRRLRQECGFFTGRDPALCPKDRIPWPHDGMRHTFATAHLAHHRNEAELQVLMGHSSADVIHAHYRGLMTPQEAARFWALRPG